MKSPQNISKSKLTIISILLITFITVMSGSALGGVSKKSLKRTDKEGSVTISATYLNPLEKTNTDELHFEVKLDTHSVALDQYKLEELSFISFNNRPEQRSIGLNKKGAGHHITNILRFAGSVPKGAKIMTLTIRNVGDIAERQLEWKLPVE